MPSPRLSGTVTASVTWRMGKVDVLRYSEEELSIPLHAYQYTVSVLRMR